MQKKVRNAGLIALAAGVVLVPVVRYLVRRYRNAKNSEGMQQEPRKGLFTAYRGHHKPHHRKAVDGQGVH